MITKSELDFAVAMFDLFITGAERFAAKIEEGKKAGLVPVAEQQDRMDKVDAIRKQVGLADPTP